jgi:ribosomal protein L30E
MKITISLENDYKGDPTEIFEKIKKKAKKITEVYLLGFSQSDKQIERFAKTKKINVTTKLPNWDDVDIKGASVKTKVDKDGKEKQYNARAGFQRNEEVIANTDILVWQGAPKDYRADILEKARLANIEIIYLDEV